ncbi:hypothetical protein JBE27_02110 [Streptomyces albiflaviniger]|nr:hypothetical protein [Streptomyces albiflaviniger]
MGSPAGRGSGQAGAPARRASSHWPSPVCSQRPTRRTLGRWPTTVKYDLIIDYLRQFVADNIKAALGQSALGIESKAVNEAVGKLGSRLARWLGGAEGAAAEGAVTAEEASVLSRFVGPNLTRFMASVFGAVFAVAGLYFSIRALAQGDDSL